MGAADSSAVLASVAAAHGTPVFVYDAAQIAARVQELHRDFTGVPLSVLFSAKANPAVGIAEVMCRHGLGFDACSPGDLRLAGLAGIPRDRISYTGFGASDAELLEAAELAGDIVLDSVEEIERGAKLGLRRPIGLRINPDLAAGFHGHVRAGTHDSKFGVPTAFVPGAAVKAAEAGLPVEGLHAHLGSDIFDATPYCKVIEMLTGLAKSVPSVRWINIGGGMGAPRRDTDPKLALADIAAAARRNLRLDDGRILELRMEPGGYLTMNAGILVARVVAIKPGFGEDPTTIVADASTNHLPSVLLYDAHHAVSVIGAPPGALKQRYRVAGNLMQAGDILSPASELAPVAVDSLLAFSHAGAYAACRASVFNERPRAAEVLVDGTSLSLLRRAETVNDLFTRDVLSAFDRPATD